CCASSSAAARRRTRGPGSGGQCSASGSRDRRSPARRAPVSSHLTRPATGPVKITRFAPRASRFPTPNPRRKSAMRHRLPILMSLSCAFVLAVPAFAQDAAAPAAPAETTKAAAKPAAKPATADAAIKAIDAQIAKAAPKKTEAGWRTKLPMPTAVKFDANKQYLVHMVTNKGEVVLR